MAETSTVVTSYEVSAFDFQEARLGALCAVVDSNFAIATGTVTLKIEDIKDICVSAKRGTNTDINTNTIKYQGKGICRPINSGDLCITLRSVNYIFNNYGKGIDYGSIGYKLVLLKISSAIPWNGEGVTRGITGGQSDTESIKVTGMSARDEFANQALRGILSRIEDPFHLSDNEISYYCAAAYKWASVMMLVAANSRDKDETGTQGTTATVGSLDTNIERLLNNILVAIEGNSGGSSSGDLKVKNAVDGNNNVIPFVSELGAEGVGGESTNPLYVSVVTQP